MDRPASVSWYDEHAETLAASYRSVAPTPRQTWFADLLPPAPAIVVDVGAGVGRDAQAFADAGYDVVAIEPSAGMRDQAAALRGSPRIRWMTDSLPALSGITRAGIAADIVSVAAVWQHVASTDRPRAFRKLVGLLRSGGLLAMTLRHGPDDGRGAHPVSVAEIHALARDHGMQVVRSVGTPDLLGRAEISWTAVVMRLPDDGTGALPLLRHLILADAKSATYKLGLLRTLCRVADGSAGLADARNDDGVRVPLGLVALIWVRLYLPLIRAHLPQAPGNDRGDNGLGFAGPGWKALAAEDLSDRDLRVGAVFTGSAAISVHAALREAADHICRMPATFLAYPGGGRILQTDRRRSARPSGMLVLDRVALASFGEMRVPHHVWMALGRFSSWIEPSLIAEWSRLIKVYAARQGREVETGALAAAMTWAEPARDVALSRSLALGLMAAGSPVHCVWSGKALRPELLDVDHCLPWSVWPCGDLWNLMPAHRQVNRHGKGDRLPSARALALAGERIADWWTRAYLRPDGAVVADRFRIEATASLPGLGTEVVPGIDDVLGGIALQRLRLSRDQGVPEWEPSPGTAASPM